jgi:DNA-binding transcriptional ArsR family regulator
VSGDPDTHTEAVLRLLHDENARQILTTASTEPMTATSLSDACDASLSTVYRRVDELESCGLLRAETRYDADGDHYDVYETVVGHVGVDIEAGGLSVALDDDEDGEDDGPDRFARAWEEMRRGDG